MHTKKYVGSTGKNGEWKMNKEQIMKELLERYVQIEFVDKNNKYIIKERISKLEKMLKEML